MFGRGQWAVFGITAKSQTKFEVSLNDEEKAHGISQVNALVVAKRDEVPTFGINPYVYPRGDEAVLDTGVNEQLAVGKTEDFRLGPQQFGLWLVLNDYEDVTDPKSKLESTAYNTATKPFKFLNKEEKKVIEAQVKASAVASRKQFAVLVDFIGERVYANTNNVEEIGNLRALLEELGAETYNLSWQFGGYDWYTKFLNAINDSNKFESQMQSRAEELRRHRADEIEKLEDKMMESIVSGYFAMSELETGQWAGLYTPAKVSLFPVTEPSSEASVSTAFTILHLVDSATVASANIVFQSLNSWVNKKDEEKTSRTDLFTIELSDKINIADAGCAALRGFDLPQFKKEMKRHGKDRGSLTIKDYWFEWLIATKNAVNFFIDNVTETLHIDKQAFGMKPYESEAEEETAEV